MIRLAGEDLAEVAERGLVAAEQTLDPAEVVARDVGLRRAIDRLLERAT